MQFHNFSIVDLEIRLTNHCQKCLEDQTDKNLADAMMADRVGQDVGLKLNTMGSMGLIYKTYSRFRPMTQ